MIAFYPHDLAICLPELSAPEVIAWSMLKYSTSVFSNARRPVVTPTNSPSRRNIPVLLTWHHFAAALWRQEKQEPASTLPMEDCQHAAQLSTRTPHMVKPKMGYCPAVGQVILEFKILE